MTSLTVTGLARPHRWLRAHPLAADAFLAAATFVTVLIGATVSRFTDRHPPGSGFVLLALLACACLVLRRRAPRAVLCATSAATLFEIVHTRDTAPHTQIAMSVVVALYTVASRTERPMAWRIAAVTVGVLTAGGMAFGAPPWYSQENLALLAWTGMAGAAGDAVRSRRAYVAAIEERAVRAERTREEEARRRVAEERLRIARELHDVVAHHIALVNVQAGVASHIMDSRPDQAKEALAHVREASRSALAELRATVGLLRQYGDPEAPTEPAPGLGVLGHLVDGFARVGLDVTLTMASTLPGGPGSGTDPGEAAAVVGRLPGAVDLTAYRLLQEALTNVHKHAGPGARAEVALLRSADRLLLTVLDDGAGPPPGAGEERGGHGLIGMRERATALGGSCEAGPRADGTQGFRVRVTLPLPGRPEPTLTP
ncbi:histidine kinase [Streptomyces sp. HU2014]|uniref:histidine kinase n=1 Tax=Streptomyces albireticuli TaxID=1940 RepID=A0A1Z2L861_9ACTN|nr:MULTISPECIES: histidine kinase [Streptomyces]ARZ70489.1 putative two-component system sensor kinase [Streptomyces albireticuli]UQI44000.1 histidine kinase [Streptomyces sp. HU2014]